MQIYNRTDKTVLVKTKHILAGLGLLLLAACASIGAPDGGIYDEIPPKVIGSNPTDRSTGVTGRKMQIIFNEFIKLENANEKVIVSPPQLEPANIRADGKRVKITLFDSLQANTTYTIDFGDAITDNNEGNPMGNYTYTFSTGDEIDTMEVAGTVLNSDSIPRTPSSPTRSSGNGCSVVCRVPTVPVSSASKASRQAVTLPAPSTTRTATSSSRRRANASPS